MSTSSRRKPAPVREVLESDDVRNILRDGFFSTAPVSKAPSTAPVELDDGDEGDDGDVPVEVAVAETGRRSLTTASRAKKTSKKAVKERPDHYKVICISLYNDDLALLDRVVKELKKRGFTKANRSAVLRAAMQQFDPAKVAKGL